MINLAMFENGRLLHTCMQCIPTFLDLQEIIYTYNESKLTDLGHKMTALKV